MGDIMELLGGVVIAASGFAFLNWLMKRVHSRWVSRMPKERKGFVSTYRVVLRFFVRNHRWFGLAAGVAVVVHFAVGLAPPTYPVAGPWSWTMPPNVCLPMRAPKTGPRCDEGLS